MTLADLSLRGLCVAAWLATAAATRAQDIGVDIANASEPTLCAEEDNIDIRLHSAAVRGFRIEATHPSYIGTLQVDRWAPDFTNCPATPPAAADFRFEPRRVTLFETGEWQLVGHSFARFWRPNSVPVRVGGQAEEKLHLLQLWKRHQERAEEVLVLYPSDGYWRARPLPPAHLRWSAYGSSFLVGPVTVEKRPIVDLAEIAFDPAALAFTLRFARGGEATLRLASLDQERIALDIAFDRPIGEGLPFAALRSMFVTEFNADVAHLAWRAPDARGWTMQPVMAVTRATALELWTGRLVPSRHNTSAPDVIFGQFSTLPTRR